MNTPYSQLGQIQQAGPVLIPSQDKALDVLNKRLDTSLAEAHEILVRARITADRLFGCQPETAEGKNEPSPHCSMASLARSMECLEKTLIDLCHQISRLEAL